LFISWLPFGRLRAPHKDRTSALEAPAIESVEAPEDTATFIAGGEETRGALPVLTESLEGAVFSSRGKRYLNYNEDAAFVAKTREGHLCAAVFDQAGGLGGEVRGEASQLAARAVFSAFRTLATDPTSFTPTEAMTDAIAKAHEALLERRQAEVTTAICCWTTPDRVFLVNSGDSGALHLGGDCVVKNRTSPHSVPSMFRTGYLTHALGLEPEGTSTEAYEWDFAAGDWLVLGSDGFLDAQLSDQELGDLLEPATDAEDAVNFICGHVLRKMATMRSKPDNLSLVVLHRPSESVAELVPGRTSRPPEALTGLAQTPKPTDGSP
jgi:serine/threonine protein phosphatase PrpC